MCFQYNSFISSALKTAYEKYTNSNELSPLFVSISGPFLAKKEQIWRKIV